MSIRSRSQTEQYRHDHKVRELAEKLKDKGYRVEADIEGYPRPDTIGYKNPKRPDIYASGHGWTRIIEVETESSRSTKRARVQHEKFRHWSYRKNNRKYERVMA